MSTLLPTPHGDLSDSQVPPASRAQYSRRVRVWHHQNPLSQGDSSAEVSFIATLKQYESLSAIMTLTLGGECAFTLDSRQQDGTQVTCANNQFGEISALQLIDPNKIVSSVSQHALQELLSSLLLAAYEFSEHHQINNWLVSVNSTLVPELEGIGAVAGSFGCDDAGRCTLMLNTYPFIQTGVPILEKWSRELFSPTAAWSPAAA